MDERMILELLREFFHHKPVATGMVDVATIRDDNDDNISNDLMILRIRKDVDDAATIKIRYSSGQIATIPAWYLKNLATEVTKVYATPADITDDQIYLAK